MRNVLVLTAVFLAIAGIQLTPLLQQGQRRTVVTYGVLLGAAYLLSMLITLGIPLPYVSTTIHQFIVRLFNLSKGFGAA